METVGQKIRAILIRMCNLNESYNEMSEEQTLESIGVNSIKFVEIVVAIENEFEFEFRDEDLDLNKYTTVGSLITYVQDMRCSS